MHILPSQALTRALRNPLSERLRSKITAALNEETAYAADELVDVAEEVLRHLAALAITHYLRESPQKEIYNDFLLELLEEGGHQLNAGPIYRWAANMIKDCPMAQSSRFYSYYWELDTESNAPKLASRVNHLSELRNQLMHGFFVFPPEKNIAEAEHLGLLFEDLHRDGLLSIPADFPFLTDGHFNGRWEVQSDDEWTHYRSDSDFGKLVERILSEKSEAFWQSEATFVSGSTAQEAPAELIDFVKSHTKGAIACWVHPEDTRGFEVYRSMAQWLAKQSDVMTMAYRMHDLGLSYSGSFVLERLIQMLQDPSKTPSKNKKKADIVSSLRKSTNKKIIVLVHGIHHALFSPQHLARMANFLYDNDILLVAVGKRFEHLIPFFNASIQLDHPPAVPSADQRKELLHAYLRFKGPFFDRAADQVEVERLLKILEKVCIQLEQGQPVVARRFADQESYDIEYVHEIFALLHPWVNTDRLPFEEDVLDEEFGFPTMMTEVTPIYMILGRRDLRLEYRHKVLSL